MNSLQHGCVISLASAILALTGCVVVPTGNYTPPAKSVGPAEYSSVVPRGFDETWSALVDHAAGAFFSIENFEKESGLMTLDFGSTDPSAFVDCGLWTAKSAAESFSGKYLDFIIQYNNADFTGKMNILVKQQGSDKSLVRVNARYIVAVPLAQGVPANTWSFDSGGQAEVAVSNPMKGTTPTRVCRPTYKAERNILDAVKKLAASN